MYVLLLFVACEVFIIALPQLDLKQLRKRVPAGCPAFMLGTSTQRLVMDGDGSWQFAQVFLVRGEDMGERGVKLKAPSRRFVLGVKLVKDHGQRPGR